VAAKLNVNIAAAAGAFEHVLELRQTSSGKQASETSYSLDGEETGQANWARLGPGLYSILIGGQSYEARVSTANAAGAQHYDVRVGVEHFRVTIRDPRARRPGANFCNSAGPLQITAPMPGKVVRVLVHEGEEVTAGQGLLVMEAMKMQNELRAPRAGTIERIHTTEGVGVETGSPLLQLV
jgi:biotin carboxyl carrier protein